MNHESPFNYGEDHLNILVLDDLLQGRRVAKLGETAREHVRACRERVERMAHGHKAVYGINTGFGPLCDTRISPEDTHQLQINLLFTHAVGVGKPIAEEIAKAMMICKVHSLCKGYSGIRLEVIERIIYFIEHDLIPAVPEQGSVGASGDLAPLAHLFLPLLGEGAFLVDGKETPAPTVLKSHGLEPIQLQSKEGLALINGTQFILAHAVIGLRKMAYLLDLADVAGAMSVEGFQGSAAPYQALIHEIRPFEGCITVARRMRAFLDGSQNMNAHQGCDRVQDPYSIRCIPQVHGASRNAFLHVRELVEIELNSVTDNPIISPDDQAISGGNFHGQPLAMALDYASIAASELGNISDRRCYLLLEGKFGLPRLLTTSGGLNSGYMIPQYTTAALVTENKSLCFPPSADSIPTSMGQEDHVSMGSISARKFNQILQNLEKILAIELMYAAQAIEFRRPNTLTPLLEENFSIIRSKVRKLEADRLLKPDIDAMIQLVAEQKLIVDV